MKIIHIVFASILILFSSHILKAQHPTDSIAIRKVFTQYSEALINKDGVGALSSIDDKTLMYYSDILDKARYADSIELEQMSIVDKLMVFVSRYRCDKKQLQTFNGSDFFVYAVNEGLIGDNTAKIKLFDIEVLGEYAIGYINKDKSRELGYLSFYKKDKLWYLNLVDFLKSNEPQIRNLLLEEGQSEKEFIENIFKFVYNLEDLSSIYHPPFKK